MNIKFCGSVKKWLKLVLCCYVCQCGVNLSFGVQYLCLPVTIHLDYGITQICIIMWPDLSETCLVVAGDPPLNNFIMQQFYIS